MLIRPLVLCLSVLLSSPLVAQESAPRPTPGDQSTDNEMPATADDAFALSMLMAVDDHEIAQADLARKKILAQPVADYAKALFDEHTAQRARSEEVRRAIGAERVEAADIAAMVQARQASRATLDDIDTSDEFEAAWLDATIKEHVEALALIDSRLVPAAKNDDVQAHLQMARGHMASHLEQARMLVANPDR